MTRSLVVLLLILTLLGTILVPAVAEGDPLSCTVIEGVIHGVSVPRFEGEALVGFDVTVTEVTGPLSGGEITASLNITAFLADGSLTFDGIHRFVNTQAGTFTTEDGGLTGANGGIANTLTIVEGGSGFLVTMGHVDLETGKLALEYRGLVCTP